MSLRRPSGYFDVPENLISEAREEWREKAGPLHSMEGEQTTFLAHQNINKQRRDDWLDKPTSFYTDNYQ